MSIMKFDVDVKMDGELFKAFVFTRESIIRDVGYEYVKARYRETRKGYHFWFYVAEKLTEKESAELQFLLGDDQARCRFNFLRCEAKVFRAFNALFSKKFKHKWEALEELWSTNILVDLENEEKGVIT